MDTIQKLQLLRADLIREIDDRIGSMIQELKENADTEVGNGKAKQKEYESMYPLHGSKGVFKGKQPTGVIYGGKKRKNVKTWKEVFEEIVKDCNKDADKHKALMELRGKLAGRSRVLLDNKRTQMRSPVEIDRNLYAETHYDAETLMRIMSERILDAVGYDYSGITIAVKSE